MPGPGPVYLVYEIESMTGTAFTDFDVPDALHFVGSCQAVNGDAARNAFIEEVGTRPLLVLRANTVQHFGLKVA